MRNLRSTAGYALRHHTYHDTIRDKVGIANKHRNRWNTNVDKMEDDSERVQYNPDLGQEEILRRWSDQTRDSEQAYRSKSWQHKRTNRYSTGA
jgi:hypothetical protein